MAPKIAKRSPKRRQDGQHGAKMGQDGPQEAAKWSQDGDLSSMLGAFGIDFQSFWMLFGCQAAYQKTLKNRRFSVLFEGLGSRMEAKSKKKQARWPC